MKRVAIIQSNYLPWKGYFDLIASVDEVVLYDDMQYTRRDWRNRNQIKTPHGVQWLTVPVKVKGKFNQSIRATEIDGDDWRDSHWKTIFANYRRAPNFFEVRDIFEPLFLSRNYVYLSELNRTFIEAVCSYLNIRSKISNSWDYVLVDGKTERLVNICLQAGAGEYVSGPAARAYIDPSVFESFGVSLTWFDYADYPEYPQLWGEFTHFVSILDLLFNCGRNSIEFMRCVRQNAP
jgi:hypothetical protein